MSAALRPLSESLAQLLIWLGLLGLLCIPLSSALHDFSVRQQIKGQFATFKAGLIEKGLSSQALRRIKLLYSNVRVVDNDATIDLVLNVPQSLVGQLGRMQDQMIKRAKNIYGIDEVEINISVIPTQILHFNPGSSRKT